uniref:Uncharacterized protein n=1 Tax=Caenorhabditis japonica TaxID=281687 RepID=A0A8R1IDT4_CAEJA
MRTRNSAHLIVRDHANTAIFEETQTERAQLSSPSEAMLDTGQNVTNELNFCVKWAEKWALESRRIEDRGQE